MISDASWAEADHEGVRGKACFVVMSPIRDERRGGVLTIRDNDPITSRLEQRSSQILAGELLGPMLALAYAGPALAHTCTSFYLDNLSGLCSIVSGCSRRTDLAGVACGIQVGMDVFRVKEWYDYVESESNFTDGGSRIGIECPLAAEYDVPLIEIKNFTLPASFPHSTPSQWREWWTSTIPQAIAFRKEVEEMRARSR